MNNNTIGRTILMGTIKIEGVDGEMWSIDNIEYSNSFAITSTKGYYNEETTLDRSIKKVRERIKIDMLDKKSNL